MENFLNFIKYNYNNEIFLSIMSDYIGNYFFHFSNDFKDLIIHKIFLKNEIDLKKMAIIDLHFKQLNSVNKIFNLQFTDLIECLCNIKHNSNYLTNMKLQILYYNQKYKVLNIDNNFISCDDKSYIQSLKSGLKRKKRNIPKTLKLSVWNKYVGQDRGSCACFCCKTTMIYQGNFECGHLISEYNGGKTEIENLIPICGLCNKSMSSNNYENFTKIFN